MRILYFARIREKVGRSEDLLDDLPRGIATVDDLVGHLAGRGDGYVAAFADRSVVRVAVNQVYADFLHPVMSDDEIAFFPPVTGG